MKLTAVIISTLCMSIVVDARIFRYGPQQATWQCPDGWQRYGTSCFHIGMDRVSWGVARQTCQSFGADLATDKDENTHAFLKAMPSTGFKWVDDTPLKTCFLPWNGPEPNGSPSKNWNGYGHLCGLDNFNTLLGLGYVNLLGH
ncbi:perlucin-like protein [Glandiceps talaboti]